MSGEDGCTLDGMILKLARLAELTAEDRQALSSLTYTTTNVPNGRYLVREGTRVSDCCLLVAGYACRHKLTVGGGRQIVSFHLPGDLLDVQHLLLEAADHNVQAITDASVAWIPRSQLRILAWRRPAIGEALWRDSLIDASVFREWVLNVGRRDARSRVTHLLCEFAARCRALGIGSDGCFDLPMTQEQIADAVGLTPVHVNRMLMALATDGAIKRKGRKVEVNDWERLRRIADFDPAYLHAAA
jgi:CRP-like cAMP-binding protein